MEHAQPFSEDFTKSWTKWSHERSADWTSIGVSQGNREIYVVMYVVIHIVGFMKLISWSICRDICRHRFDENFHIMIQFDVSHREIYVVVYVVRPICREARPICREKSRLPRCFSESITDLRFVEDTRGHIRRLRTVLLNPGTEKQALFLPASDHSHKQWLEDNG